MNGIQATIRKLNFLPQIYKKMIIRQLLIGTIIALILSLSINVHSGISFFAGIMPIVFGVIIASPIANKKDEGNPGSIVINALKAEAVKISIIVVALWLEFKFYQDLVPMALVGGLIMAALISGMAISGMNNIKIENKE